MKQRMIFITIFVFLFGIFWVDISQGGEVRETKAIYDGTLLASSKDVVVVEDNVYFPDTSANIEYFLPSNKTSVCPWKGLAHYAHININGRILKNAAWYYPEPLPGGEIVKNRIAFNTKKGIIIIS